MGDGEVASGGGFGESDEGAHIAGEGMGLVEDAHFVCVWGVCLGRMYVRFVGEVQACLFDEGVGKFIYIRSVSRGFLGRERR